MTSFTIDISHHAEREITPDTVSNMVDVGGMVVGGLVGLFMDDAAPVAPYNGAGTEANVTSEPQPVTEDHTEVPIEPMEPHHAIREAQAAKRHDIEVLPSTLIGKLYAITFGFDAASVSDIVMARSILETHGYHVPKLPRNNLYI